MSSSGAPESAKRRESSAAPAVPGGKTTRSRAASTQDTKLLSRSGFMPVAATRACGAPLTTTRESEISASAGACARRASS